MINSIIDSLQYEFVRNALLAGSCIAIVAAVVGYFLIARGLTFAGHALPNIGFAGAAGAVLLGISPIYGLFVFTIVAGIVIALLGKEVRERDISIGVIMTLALGLGVMFLSLYSGYAERVYGVLFGSILGISHSDVWIMAVTCLLTLLAILLLYRPLLFSSFDPMVALARGLPVRMLAIIFMILTAIAVSVSIQIVGALLVFTLLVGPAATAVRLAHRPVWALLIAVMLGLSYMWGGILLAVANGIWPASFYIATISFIVYLIARVVSPYWIGQKRRSQAGRDPIAHSLASTQFAHESTSSTIIEPAERR
ncbi:metal ABC transporter permease [Dictyobacter arantiisoli]|uniref:ABC transporter permease n=1 Tax=Dictyobacter arantiisoli TaxID=2014874 RepID=A0A5A5TCG8_9CHLR|nr:metal ABC transporter permease [Dictyobacter arantiisoli]GCF08723.1 ABC transporter permease [Dictyobacter arantiisoli]